MKSTLVFALPFLAFAGVSPAVEKPAPSCCAPAPEAKPAACCAAITAAEKPFAVRSLYQLDAAWTNDGGKPVALASLRGRPVVLAMFFAQCEYACPVLVQDIQCLRAALPERVREKTEIVLVTFDTVRDTPAALQAFRARMSLDERWTLLTGNHAAVQELAMLLGVKFKKDANGQFAHSNLITVLNPEGEIVHQRIGLMGDLSEAAKAVVLTMP